MAQTPNPAHEKAQPRPAETTVAVNTQNAAARQTGRNLRLIIAREYTSRVRGRGYRVTTLILTLAVVIAAFLPTIVQYFSSRTNAQTSVVIMNNAGLADAALLATANTSLNGTSIPVPYAITLQSGADQNALVEQVRNGKLGILLGIQRGAGGKLRFTNTTSYSAATDPNQGPMTSLATVLTFQDGAQKLGLSAAQTASLMTAPDLTSVNTQEDQAAKQSDTEQSVRLVFAIVGTYLMLYAVIGYAAGVAQGVAQEKGSRVMEILVNAATPFQLLAGKIVGIALASLAQMACMAVFGIAALLIQTPLQARLFGTSADGFTQFLTSVSIPAYVYFLVYFLMNFFLFAAIFAGLGAMVKGPEEVAGATMLATILLIAGFFGSILEITHPNAGWVKALAYIPFLTGPLMFGRATLGTASGWEIGLTILLLLASIYFCTLGAVRIYRHGVLNYGQRPGLGGLLKLARKP